VQDSTQSPLTRGHVGSAPHRRQSVKTPRPRPPTAAAAIVVAAVGESVTDHPAIFSAITLDHHVEGPSVDRDAVRRSVELSATRYCPVTAMLSAGETRIVHRFRLGPVNEGEPEEIVVTGPRGAGLAAPA